MKTRVLSGLIMLPLLVILVLWRICALCRMLRYRDNGRQRVLQRLQAKWI